MTILDASSARCTPIAWYLPVTLSVSWTLLYARCQLGTVTDTNASLYGMSKAALLYLTRAMAVELAGFGIVVNAVSPGTTATEFILATLTGAQRASRIERIPAGRHDARDIPPRAQPDHRRRRGREVRRGDVAGRTLQTSISVRETP